MIIYTDLHNRTKNYTLLKDTITQINHLYNVKITTKINPKAEIYWGDKLTDNHLEQMPNLKWIHLSKAGYGKFNLPQTTFITNTPESSNGVAEYALTGILYLLRGLDRMSLDRKSFDNNINHILPFNKVKCLIVGFGNIGQQLKNLLSSLNINSNEITRHHNIKEVLLKSNYNFIINCLPFNDTTQNYFSEKIFNLMGKDTYFVNVGRGETVNETDLYNTLKTNNIRGAFLDVIQNEPIKITNKLLSLNNTFISPHIANASIDSLDTQIKVFINNLVKYKNNQPLNNIIT